MFHIVAYNTAIGQTANTDIAAVTDAIIPISNSHFLPYRDYKLFAAYTGSATITRSRLNSGTIRQVNPTYIRPISVSLLPPNNPNWMWLRNNPFTVHAHEELQNEATSGLAMGTEQLFTFLWWETSYQPVPQGDIFALRYTGTTASGTRAWTVVTYTLETGLPAGRYAVIDHVHQATNGLAARLIFDNQIERPGMLNITGLGNRNPYHSLYGTMGLWGTFFTYSLPRLEVFNNAADAAYEGYFKVVKLSGGAVP